MLVVPVTVAVNCCETPTCRVALAGETVTFTGVDDAVMPTVALADFVVSATLLAVTLTEPPLGTAWGAVYRPLELIVPTTELPP